MKIQDSLRACHASSLMISVGVNVLLLMFLLAWIDRDPPPPPLGTVFERIELKPTEVITDPPKFVPDDKPVLVDDLKTPFREFESDPPVVSEPPSTAPVSPVEPIIAFNAGPVFMEGLPGPRDPELRNEILKTWKKPGEESEAAVIRALVWLEACQREDGAWSLDGTERGAANAGATGLAVLTFLSHGETPSSDRFGSTVARALRWLVERQDSEGIYRPAGAHTAYGHAIATYAVAEAYAMTRNPLLLDSLERGLDVILDGQQPNGGFDYEYRRADRNDLSLSAWQAQALKAATLSGAGGAAVEAALRRALDGMLEGSAKGAEGRAFAYTVEAGKRGGGERRIITAAAALCLRYAGRGEASETRETDRYLSRFASRGNLPEWGVSHTGEEHGGEIMFWYYLAQAFYQRDPDGGESRRFLPALMETLSRNQAPDGHWDDFTERGAKHGPVVNTTMAALGLMFYRNNQLPTAGGKVEREGKRGEKDALVFEI